MVFKAWRVDEITAGVHVVRAETRVQGWAAQHHCDKWTPVNGADRLSEAGGKRGILKSWKVGEKILSWRNDWSPTMSHAADRHSQVRTEEGSLAPSGSHTTLPSTVFTEWGGQRHGWSMFKREWKEMEMANDCGQLIPSKTCSDADQRNEVVSERRCPVVFPFKMGEITAYLHANEPVWSRGKNWWSWTWAGRGRGNCQDLSLSRRHGKKSGAHTRDWSSLFHRWFVPRSKKETRVCGLRCRGESGVGRQAFDSRREKKLFNSKIS